MFAIGFRGSQDFSLQPDLLVCSSILSTGAERVLGFLIKLLLPRLLCCLLTSHWPLLAFKSQASFKSLMKRLVHGLCLWYCPMIAALGLGVVDSAREGHEAIKATGQAGGRGLDEVTYGICCRSVTVPSSPGSNLDQL